MTLDPAKPTSSAAGGRSPQSVSPPLRLLRSDEAGTAGGAIGPPHGLISASPIMKSIVMDLERFAATRATVLLSGESGTGKEICAQLLHSWSQRVEAPFVPVNCAALPDQLAESELFGHVEGAFTGADRTRLGSFEAAQRGTLFLDEISEMSRGLQAKLLRVLEAGEIQRLGSDQRQHVDVRVLAATNRDLRVEIDRKRFRADLFYRINVLHIHLPPLRERPEDIPPLVDFFVNQYRHESLSEVEGVAPQVLETLMQYRWPGNIRELRNVIHRACILCKTGTLQMVDIATKEFSDAPVELGDFRELSLAEMERRAILHALRKHAGNKTAAARHLGVTSRTLHNKLNRDVDLRKAS